LSYLPGYSWFRCLPAPHRPLRIAGIVVSPAPRLAPRGSLNRHLDRKTPVRIEPSTGGSPRNPLARCGSWPAPGPPPFLNAPTQSMSDSCYVAHGMFGLDSASVYLAAV